MKSRHTAGKTSIDQHQNQHQNQHQSTTYAGHWQFRGMMKCVTADTDQQHRYFTVSLLPDKVNPEGAWPQQSIMSFPLLNRKWVGLSVLVATQLQKDIFSEANVDTTSRHDLSPGPDLIHSV